MSQNMRATPRSSGRHGSTRKVDGSGMAIMSDSSIALKPVIEEPSKPMPPSKASSSSAALTEKLFSCPRMSVNQRRTKRMSRSSTKARISSAVCGWSGMGLLDVGSRRRGAKANGARSGARRGSEPGAGPHLERPHGGLEGAALAGEAVLHAHRHAVDDAAVDDPAPLELLEALGQEPVGDVRHEHLDLGEAQRAVHEHEDDRPRPALADQLDRLVVRGAAALATREVLLALLDD